MDIMLTVKQDKILCDNWEPVIHTGNANFYQLCFSFSSDWEGLEKFVVFMKDEKNIVIKLDADKCLIPEEMLIASGYVSLGVYATNGQTDDYLRISSNMLNVFVDTGAYHDGTAPEAPTPDIWEQYIAQVYAALKHSVPYIGENKHWWVWNAEKQEYADTGVGAVGSGSSNDFIINISLIDNVLTADKTFKEIVKAFDSGMTVFLHDSPGNIWFLESRTDNQIIFTKMLEEESLIYVFHCKVTSEDVWEETLSLIDTSGNDTVDDKLSETSTNPVQNKVIAMALKKVVTCGTVITSITENTLTLAHNQEARLGELSELILVLPAEINELYNSSFSFKSGETATTITDNTDIIWSGDDVFSDGVFTPQANTTYEVSVKSLGDNGIVARVGAF